METLRQKLFASETGQVVSLVGLGGVGKTQVALQVAHWTKENKPDHSVFWVPAVNSASFDQGYTEISKKLAIRKTLDDEGLREFVRRCLSSKETGRWLLVVDNADNIEALFGSSENPDRIHQYLPETGDGTIMLTTRSRDVALAVGGEMVKLLEMNEEEAKSLLTKSLTNKNLIDDEKGVATLLEQLTYLLLALAQAAVYLNRNRISIAKYVELLTGTEQDIISLMSREFHDSTRYNGSLNAVATTWLVSFHQIQKSNSAATKLLLFLSCIEPKAIPQSMLPPLPSEEAMVYAIGTLDGYAFLVRRGNTEIFDMHSLVHLAMRIWVERDAMTAQAQREAIQHIANIFPLGLYENRDQWRAYLPHAIRLLQGNEAVTIAERYTLYYKVGLCFFTEGRTTEALRCLEECYHWQQAHLPSNHPDKVRSQRDLAAVYRRNGQSKKAISLLEEVVEIELPLAKDHPDRLTSLHALAELYHDNGQIKKAISLLEEVVEIEEHTLAKDHPDRLTSLHTLAISYRDDGQIKKAISLLEEVVEIREHTLAKDHPHRLGSEHELARILWELGQKVDAVQLMEHVVEVRKNVLDQDHPDRQASEEWLKFFHDEISHDEEPAFDEADEVLLAQ